MGGVVGLSSMPCWFHANRIGGRSLGGSASTQRSFRLVGPFNRVGSFSPWTGSVVDRSQRAAVFRLPCPRQPGQRAVPDAAAPPRAGGRWLPECAQPLAQRQRRAPTGRIPRRLPSHGRNRSGRDACGLWCTATCIAVRFGVETSAPVRRRNISSGKSTTLPCRASSAIRTRSSVGNRPSRRVCAARPCGSRPR